MPGSRFRTARAGRGSGRSSSPQPARATADVLQPDQFGTQGAILHEFMMGPEPITWPLSMTMIRSALRMVDRRCAR